MANEPWSTDVNVCGDRMSISIEYESHGFIFSMPAEVAVRLQQQIERAMRQLNPPRRRGRKSATARMKIGQ